VTSERSFVVHNILNALGNVVHILGGQAADGDSSVLGHVDVMLLDHSLGLLGGKAGEREHTDLSSDVGPVSLNSDLLDRGTKSLSHGEDSVANSNEFGLPLSSKLNVVQKLSCNSGSVLGRGRVVSSDQYFNLRHDAAGILFVVADNMEGTSALTVESHNLSERLRDNHLEALVEEVSEAIGIGVELSGGEALVGSVEEGEKLVLGADFGDLSPLSLSGVDTGGVVSAGVEEDNRSRLGLGEVLEHAVDVESLGLGVEVSVLVDREADGSEDGGVVTPGRVADINGGVSVLSKE